MSSKKDILSLVDFLNSFLRPEKITVQAQRKQDVLEVVIYFENAIDFSKVSRFVIREIRDGRLDSIERVIVYSRYKNTEKNLLTNLFSLKENNDDINQGKFEIDASIPKTKEKVIFKNEKKETQNIEPDKDIKIALEQCSQAARIAYKVNYKYTQRIEEMLLLFNQELDNKRINSLYSKKASNFEKVFDDIRAKIDKILDEILNDLRLSLDTKKANLENYTIALFGRTKAGKSTIRETLSHGDGSTIGKGGQRTTREVHEYQWRGLRLIDTPGIEAYQGEEDTAKADDIIDQSDMILFLTTDDSVQMGEFNAIQKFKEIHKYFVVLLNVKERLNTLEDIEEFLDNSQDIFDEKRLSELHLHIVDYTKQQLGIEKIDIVDIHARAAFLSIQDEYTKFSGQLWDLSRIEKVYNLICDDIFNNGVKRRIGTFFDGTDHFFLQIEEALSEIQDSLKSHLKLLENKEKNIDSIFYDSIKDGDKKIETEINKTFFQFKQRISYFVDNSIGTEKAQKNWEDLTQEYKVKLEQLTEQIFSEILINLKDNLKEFEREYNYDISNINFQFKIDYINKGKYGSTLTTIGLVLSGLATAGFIAANWWNPA